MAVQWNLLGDGFDASQVLQSYGMAAKQKLAQQRMEQQRQVGSMAAAGDYTGARNAALQNGDYDTAAAIGKLDAGQRAQLGEQSRVLAAVSTRLRSLPPEQRAAAFQQIAPALRQQGFADDKIASADLSDGGLDGYIAMGRAYLDHTDKQDEPSVIRTLKAVGIDPMSPEGKDIVTRSISAPRYLPNGDGTFTVVGGGAPAPQSGGANGPQIGAVEDGYRFKGGNPADPNAWEQVGGAPSQGGATFR